ncbi:MAG TPA: RNA polymerase factor sigma-54, partial [Gammaproteobacteria bacterium]
LLWQLRMSPMSPTDEAIAMTIVDAIDDDGYLHADLEEIRVSLGNGTPIELEEVEAVLHRVQSLDPPGVGARNPGECLALQLRQLDPTTPWLHAALLLVEEHLELLARQDLDRLSKALGLGEEHLRQVVALIRSLHPRPGIQVPSQPPEYVIPDVVVRKLNGQWRVDLNQEIAPRLRINAQYARLVRRADNSRDNQCLKSHLQEARWFLKSLQSRHETLLKVARCIVDRQREFLEHGDEAMQPLILRDVAEEVGMHESTISRVTTRKYMHTPRGLFEFKYFFSSHVSTSDGGAASATAIRALIRRLIGEENVAKPLSDSKIARLLSDQGIQVARRTVAKYREAMTIPPSNERKRLM